MGAVDGGVVACVCELEDAPADSGSEHKVRSNSSKISKAIVPCGNIKRGRGAFVILYGSSSSLPSSLMCKLLLNNHVATGHTSERQAIPEPFLPDKLDSRFSCFIEFLSILHLLCDHLCGTRAQQMCNSHRPFQVLRILSTFCCHLTVNRRASWYIADT